LEENLHAVERGDDRFGLKSQCQHVYLMPLLCSLTAHPASPPAIPLRIAYSKLCFSIFRLLPVLPVVLEAGDIEPIEPIGEVAVSLIGADWEDCGVMERS
jgi:hypothetical protein